MKNKWLLVLNILVILLCAVLLILHFTGTIEMTRKTFMKAGTLLVTYFLGVWNYFIKTKTPAANYADIYKHILRDAFSTDKAGYRQLMKGIDLYNDDRYNIAIKQLSKLEKRCVTYRDTSAVLFFIAECHHDKGETGKAVEIYERLLKIDASNSTAWSNLGLIHHEAGRGADAKYALSQAILYNPENAYAYCNLANVLYRNGEFEEARNMGLKSFQLNNQLSEAASVTALAYACLGDEENARKFCKIYGTSENSKNLIAMVEEQLHNN